MDVRSTLFSLNDYLTTTFTKEQTHITKTKLPFPTKRGQPQLQPAHTSGVSISTRDSIDRNLQRVSDDFM